MRARGFTLIELLVVIIIIGAISAVALPSIMDGLSHRQVSESARIFQASLGGAKDRALNLSAPCGIRLLPDSAFPVARLASGQVDFSQPLIYSQIANLDTPGDYSSGMVNFLPGMPQSIAVLSYPGPGSSANGLPIYGQTTALVLYEVQADPATGLINEPTSWAWNIRVGDKIQINSSGNFYTVIGPMMVTPAQV